MLRLILPAQPITKKNSQQILINKSSGRPFIMPSKQYKKYRDACGEHIDYDGAPIDEPVNVKCTYYTGTRRKVDMVNLMQATFDILVDFEILADDNNTIIQSVDGSRVLYDKDNPRVEIEITSAQ
jgi:Holliday junction resolvase RusA-like endonuclease